MENNYLVSRLQFISNGSAQEQVEQIRRACEHGIDWVQLRLKNCSKEVILDTAFEVKEICHRTHTTFILNDHVDIAVKVDCDGVHIGKQDISPTQARTLLGNTKIIGCTANTFEDVKILSQFNINYIGIGPYRFTTTKEKLSPILGLEGYQEVLENMKLHNINIPLIAIGGIQVNDVKSIMNIGMHGIAVSGAISNTEQMQEAIKQFKTLTSIL